MFDIKSFMEMLVFLKGKKEISQRDANATLYPHKIIVGTEDRVKNSYAVIAANVTILDPSVDSETLGCTLRYHLGLSREYRKIDNVTERYKAYMSMAGFKNKTEHYRNALHLAVVQKVGKIIIEPTINGGPTGKGRGFVFTNDNSVTVDEAITDKDLGEKIRIGWDRCVCNYS